MRLAQPGGEAAAAAQQLVARYKQLLGEHPDDPRFELLLARAYHFADDREQATNWLKAAAARDTTDPDTARVLTSLLEQYDLYAESNAVLERLAGAEDDALHLRPLVQRLWQSDRDKDVLKRTENLDPESPTSDTELLAYRALALYDQNRTAEAGQIVDGLELRKDDMAAGAWAMALRAREDENLAPQQRVAAVQGRRWSGCRATRCSTTSSARLTSRWARREPALAALARGGAAGAELGGADGGDRPHVRRDRPHPRGPRVRPRGPPPRPAGAGHQRRARHRRLRRPAAGPDARNPAAAALARRAHPDASSRARPRRCTSTPPCSAAPASATRPSR